MKKDLIYQLALCSVPSIGYVHAKTLLQHFPTAESIFKAPVRMLEKVEGIGTARAKSIAAFKDFAAGEQEIRFMEKYQVRPIFMNDPDYPKRLLQCYDPPTLLFYKGKADLNAERMIAVIGTRIHSGYGKKMTEELIRSLAEEMPGVCIVSGLAFGIDAIAHTASLKHQLPTVGVLAHGMATIYPKEHAGLAREMMQEGGLLTEFTSRKAPDKHHFPTRNRIVAGCCDAVVVVETGVKGGSMITAELANGYNRDVFAIPGRVSDLRSEGCNQLIRDNKAAMLRTASDLMEWMGWKAQKKKALVQPKLFPELSPPEALLVELLRSREMVHMEEFRMRSGMTPGTLAGALLNLELQQVIELMPGKMYRLR
ncbi:MAG: DNA-processing protein DprA [Chitinophagaceae bacterium]|nr:DNA-processing protein DprA [Chitinophagaceae bacterium]